MSYSIDKSLAFDGIFKYTTDLGCQYLAKAKESAPGSGLWTLDFIKLKGTPDPIEVFKTMKTLTELCMEFVEQKGVKNVLMTITGESQEEIEKKTKAFERWIRKDWDYTVIKNMEVNMPGLSQPNFIIPTNSIMMTRRENKLETPVSKLTGVNIKFCYNCGTENGGWQFCPTCGTNLKQN